MQLSEENNTKTNRKKLSLINILRKLKSYCNIANKNGIL